MATMQLRVEGMDCGGCARAVEIALQTVPGVLRARVDLAGNTADAEVGDTVTPQQLIAAVEKAGFQAEIAG